MKSLARLCVRHRWYVLVVWIVLFVGLTIASQVAGSAFSNTFSLPGTNSANAYQLLSTVQAEKGDADQIVFQSLGGPVAAHRDTIDAMLAKVNALPVVADVTSPFCPATTTATPCLGAAQVSKDGTIAYAVVHFAQPGYKLTTNQITQVEQVGATIRSSSLNVQFGGNAFGQLDSPTSSPGEIFGLIATAIILQIGRAHV